MQKIYKVVGVLLLGLFSFFYTEKVIEFIRESDPIMRNIKKSESDYRIDPVNAKIKDNKIIPGISGKVIDYDSSYKKMKKYGTYNESLTVFKEELPAISIDDYYDKYISQGSGINNDVSLVFEVKINDNITNILNTLIENNTKATFFVDGLWLENNKDLATSMAEEGYEIEILNYDSNYDELYFSSSLTLVNSITNLKPKYCFAKYDNKEVLELCKKLSLHTIIPTIITGNYPYSDVKAKLSKGSIIGFNINSSTEIELSTVINYIKQKGYVMNTLDNLLSEAADLK
ncbi:MAG: polysaccharide deacetylase family protein [Bacilli bacterium]|nr:polysaccharide deacetylase family protein [Bacilli bacterium]